jgi:hypothetical protein
MLVRRQSRPNSGYKHLCPLDVPRNARFAHLPRSSPCAIVNELIHFAVCQSQKEDPQQCLLPQALPWMTVRKHRRNGTVGHSSEDRAELSEITSSCHLAGTFPSTAETKNLPLWEAFAFYETQRKYKVMISEAAANRTPARARKTFDK